MLCVVCVMALLAKRPKVCRVAVLWSMVEVRNSQHDPAPVLSDGIVLNPAELAAVICPFKNACADLLPVLGISGFIFWFNRHIVDWRDSNPHRPSAVARCVLPFEIQSIKIGAVRCFHFSHTASHLPGLFRTDAPPLVHSLGITPWAVCPCEHQGLTRRQNLL